MKLDNSMKPLEDNLIQLETLADKIRLSLLGATSKLNGLSTKFDEFQNKTKAFKNGTAEIKQLLSIDSQVILT